MHSGRYRKCEDSSKMTPFFLLGCFPIPFTRRLCYRSAFCHLEPHGNYLPYRKNNPIRSNLSTHFE